MARRRQGSRRKSHPKQRRRRRKRRRRRRRRRRWRRWRRDTDWPPRARPRRRARGVRRRRRGHVQCRVWATSGGSSPWASMHFPVPALPPRHIVARRITSAARVSARGHTRTSCFSLLVLPWACALSAVALRARRGPGGLSRNCLHRRRRARACRFSDRGAGSGARGSGARGLRLYRNYQRYN